MNTDLLIDKLQDQLEVVNLDVVGIYTLDKELNLKKIVSEYEQDTDVDIRICIKDGEVVITIYAEHNRNHLELQKRYMQCNENDLALRISSIALSSAILVQTM